MEIARLGSTSWMSYAPQGVKRTDDECNLKKDPEVM